MNFRVGHQIKMGGSGRGDFSRLRYIQEIKSANYNSYSIKDERQTQYLTSILDTPIYNTFNFQINYNFFC